MLLAPCAYFGRVGLTAWRRKSTLLLASLLLIIIIIAVHYNMGSSSAPSTMNEALKREETNEENTRKKEESGVHFVQNPYDLHRKRVEYKFNHELDDFIQVVDEKNVQELEQPSRDEIAMRRNDNPVVTIAEIVNNDLNSYDNYANQGLSQMGIPFVNLNDKNPYIPPKRLVHIDLKGAPPKISYLKRLFPLLKTLGATGLLLEYEDMFPFHGNLSDIAALNAYSKDEVREILQAATDNSLQVIPLIQTFGHLEFALKRESFMHLREVPESPQALCPSLNQSVDFIETMINQVLELHGPTVRHLHIGCDEVYQMGECVRCRGAARDQLFLRHVRRVLDALATRHPHVRALIWDDMLRHVPRVDLIESGIGPRVDPVVWAYAEDVYRFVPTHVWDKYASVFHTVWSASAFKGAFGETQYVPNAKRHLENNLRWLELMAQQGAKFKGGFSGIVLTGWQRYDHFAVLCELLPAAIPSLALCLSAVSAGHMDSRVAGLASAALGCPAPSSQNHNPLALNTDPNLWDKFGRCFFPGNSFFKLTYKLHVAETEAREFLDQTTVQKGWMTDYNVRRSYSAPLRVWELTAELPRLQRGLTSLARSAADALSELCQPDTVAEWLEQRVYPHIIALEKVQTDSVTLLKRKTWDRRPLPVLEDFKRLGITIPER